MPSDLLMPAFVVTLLANAILIALAMRALLQKHDAIDRTPRPAPPRTPGPTATPDRSLSAPAISAPSLAAPAPEPGPASAGSEPDPSPPSTSEPEPGPESTSTPVETTAPVTPVKPKRPPRARAGAKPKSAAGAATAAAATTTTTGNAATGVAAVAGAKAVSSSRRRRFSLPNLDDDHEKVNKSIETFLASGDGADAAAAPTTVALVTLSAAHRTEAAANRPVIESVEQELRAAARGTDRVDVVEPGRWQIVLSATGELAARAYLRSVRATVEPILEEMDPPGRLIAATATVLDEPVEQAAATAERRLAALLDAENASDQEPRAAGD